MFYAGAAHLDGAPLEAFPGVTATASSELSGYEASQVVDGSGLLPNGGHASTNSFDNMWLSSGTIFGANQDTAPEITFDLGQPRSIQAMRVWNFNQVDTASCCLNRGVRLADILIAGEDQVFSTLIDDQAFDPAPGDTSDFSQQIDFSAATARYVKMDVDTSNGVANHGDPFQFVGLSEVQFLAYPPAGDVQLPLGPNAYYFRHEFNFDDAPERTSLELTTLLDDGAVVYLNGQEVYRQNMADGNVDYGTSAAFAIEHASPTTSISIPTDALRPGRNVLAVEVHQAAAGDDDMVFGLELTATTKPASLLPTNQIPLAFHELGAAGADTFFVELRNQSDQTLDLHNFRIAFDAGTEYRFAEGTTLAPGQLTSLPASTPGFSHAAGDKLALFDAAGDQVYMAAIIEPQGQAKQLGGSDEFLTPTVPTPGSENQIDLRDEIVINEIMYNYRPDAADPGSPPSFELTKVVSLDGSWRFNESGGRLGQRLGRLATSGGR